MKYSRLFWGSLFLVVGVLLLLSKADVMHISRHIAMDLWPLILVGFGVAAISRILIIRSVAIIIAALCLGLLIASFLGLFWPDEDVFVHGQTPNRQEIVEAFDGNIRYADLKVDVATGSIEVRGNAGNLLEATTFSNTGSYVLSSKGDDQARHLTLLMEKGGWRPFSNAKNSLELSLNPGPLWKLSFDLGAASLDADLSEIRTESVMIDAGAARVILRVGANVPESRVDVEAGAASVRLEVPEGAACELQVDATLSSKRFPGFEKIESGLYRTKNFGRVERTILVTLDAGASSLRVERY